MQIISQTYLKRKWASLPARIGKRLGKKGNIKPLWFDIAFFYSIFHFWTVGDAESLQVCVVLVGVGAYDDPLPRQIAHLI